MGWVKLDTGFFSHPKVLEAGGDAALLYLHVLCWCGEHATDGHVAKFARTSLEVTPFLTRDAPGSAAELAANRLLDVGLWTTSEDGSIDVHDYSAHQVSKATRDAERESARVRAKSRRDAARTSGEVRRTFARSSLADVEEIEINPTRVRARTRGGSTSRRASLPDGSSPASPRVVEEERIQRAQAAIVDRNRRVGNGEACPDCLDEGMVLGDDSLARPCPKCAETLTEPW